MTEHEAFVNLLKQAMASGSVYFASNMSQFAGSQRSLGDHFTEAAEDFAKYRGDLLEQLKEAAQ
jgi:hypothetical protein